MIPFKAKRYGFRQIKSNDCDYQPQPLLLDPNGDVTIVNISPHSHGRSFIVGQTSDGRFVVSKGNRGKNRQKRPLQ